MMLGFTEHLSLHRFMMDLPKGFRFAGVPAGIKSRVGACDVAMIVADSECTVAGVYTTNQVVAAPVVLSRTRTPNSRCRGIVVNSGNANACTGERGMADARRMTQAASEALMRHSPGSNSVTEDQWIVMSTGIIGRFLPMEKVEAGIDAAAKSLAVGEAAFMKASDGIMTTDATRKIASSKDQLPSAMRCVGGWPRVQG